MIGIADGDFHYIARIVWQHKRIGSIGIFKSGIRQAIGCVTACADARCPRFYDSSQMPDNVIVRIARNGAVIGIADIHCAITGGAAARTVGSAVVVKHQIPHDYRSAPIVYGS